MTWKWVLIYGYFLTWAAIPHLLLAKKRPASTLAWMWAILLFPYLGTLAYFVLGTDHMQRKRLRRRAGFNALKDRQHSPCQKPNTDALLEALSVQDQKLLETISRINEITPSCADRVRVLVNASNFYPALKQRILEAKHHIHMQFFIWRDDEYGREFLDLLAHAAKRGVKVRLLVDEIGSFGTPNKHFQPLIDAGGAFSWFLTLNPRQNRFFFNLRNHRKLQIFDGRIAFIGGMNMGREYDGKDSRYGVWKDVQMEVIGPVVNNLQESFADDWYFASQEKIIDPVYYPDCGANAKHLVQVIAGGPDTSRDPLHKSLVCLLNHANERVWMTTGYFVPNALLLSMLQICAARGIDVRLLVAEKNDHPYLVKVGRSYYEDLLKFGVRIYEYSEGINHSKVMSIDGKWMMVGSANMDIRSMRLNFELNALLHSPKDAQQLETILESYFKESNEIYLRHFAKRPFSHKMVEAIYRPLAPLL